MIVKTIVLGAIASLVAGHAGHNHGEKYEQKKFVGETKEDCQYVLGAGNIQC